MSEPQENLNEWSPWKEWETLTLQTNRQLPQIGLLTLNRADKLNAMNDVMIDDLNSCMDFLTHAFDCRVVVLCGAGRLFCAGADLTTGFEGEPRYDWENFPDKVKRFWQIQHELSTVISKQRRIPQPVIAAVHGAAAGGGMALVNASDIVVASKSAKFINAFIKIGVGGADLGSSYFLPRLVGFHRAAELLYSGRSLLAEEAYGWGYVNFLVERDDETIPRAVSFAADNLLAASPMGLRLTKEALNFNMDAGGIDTALKFEDRNQVLSAQAEDAFEGVAAFFEKRKPRYGPR